MPKNNLAKITSPGRIETPRKQRYARSPYPVPCVSLTPARVEILRYLAELRFLSLPQIARLCCPSVRQDLSEKNARRHMRTLFDAGLVDVLPISRAALAPPDAPNDAALLYGSAPNLYAPTVQALQLLHLEGIIDGERLKQARLGYGPKNSLFLAHELQVRGVRVWLEESVRVSGGNHKVLRWADRPQAAIGLPLGGRILPDAWFVFQVEGGEPPTVLVGLLEVDRGTERGERCWAEKLAAYAALFADRRALAAAIGYLNARVLIVAPDVRRRDGLALLLAKCAGERNLAPQVLDHFWLADRGTQEYTDLAAAVWKRPSGLLRPLIPVRPSAL